MQGLLPFAERLGAFLKARGGTAAASGSSSGGLASAALLAVPGASACFQGGAVVYTPSARTALLGTTGAETAGLRSSSACAALLARTVRSRLGTAWGVAGTRAAGPGGNRHGGPAGHTCVAVSGPVERFATVRTGRAGRAANMRAFARALLGTLTNAVTARG